MPSDSASPLFPFATAAMEKTLDKFAPGRPTSSYKVMLKSMFFATKPVKNFFKGLGRLTDTNGNTVWFELTGSSQAEVAQRARCYIAGKVNVFTSMVLRSSLWHSGGRFVDLNPQHGVRATPVPTAHPQLAGFPKDSVVAPTSSIGGLLKCMTNQRVDVVGLVVQVDGSFNRATKLEVWLKGEDGKSVLLELWGATFQKLESQLQAYASVLQVDNARTVLKDNGTMHLSAEYFGDSEKGGAFAHVNPQHERAKNLRALSHDRGEQISSAWVPSARTGIVRLVPTKGDKFVTCLSTLSTCSLAWDEGDSTSTSADALPENLEVAIFGATLVDVMSRDPVYTECLHCHTKIDLITGACKGSLRDTRPCQTTPGAKKVFAPVRLSDFSLSYGGIMIEAEELCILAGKSTLEEVELTVSAAGVQGLCCRGRFDVLIGANKKDMNKQSLTADGIPCKFQVLRAVPNTLGAWDTEERPAVPRILRNVGEAVSGQVLPIQSPKADLEATPAGVSFRHGVAFPRYILMLCCTKGEEQEPTIQDCGCGDIVEVSFGNVRPVPFQVEDESQATPVNLPEEEQFGFSKVGEVMQLEFMCERSVAEALTFHTGGPHLVLASVLGLDGEEVTLMAENMWAVTEEQQRNFQGELKGTWALLSGGVKQQQGKRSAKELTTPTPTKKKCTGGPLTASPKMLQFGESS